VVLTGWKPRSGLLELTPTAPQIINITEIRFDMPLD
jgi:hypothetical protein